MHLQNFDATEKTAPEFIDFCKCLESLEVDSGNDSEKKGHTTGEKERKCNNDDANSDKDSEKRDTECHCELHRKNNDHNADDCWTIQKMIKRQRESHKEKSEHKTKQQEINTVVIKAIQDIKKVK